MAAAGIHQPAIKHAVLALMQLLFSKENTGLG